MKKIIAAVNEKCSDLVCVAGAVTIGCVRRVSDRLRNTDGASNIEIVVWMSVVLVIAGFLFLFRNAIAGFISQATNRINNMNNEMGSAINAVNAAIPVA